MQELTQPTLLLKPFAENGDKNTIPVNATGTNLASLSEGFPPITSEDPDDGGLPPVRADFNGLGNLTTTYDYFYQAGGTFTFNPTISTAIGGYPLGARLWYTDSNGATSVLRSTIGNNTDNFNDGQGTGIGTTWVKDTPTFSDINVILKTLYPVGSIYIGTQTTCPLETLISGSTWEKVEGRYLLSSGTLAGTSETYSATNTVASGVPNITGSIGPVDRVYGEPSGAFYANAAVASSGWTSSNNSPEVYFDASRSSGVYGSSSAVRSPAYVVNVWRRTA